MDKETKDEINEGFKIFSFIGKKVLWRFILVIILLAFVGVGVRYCNVNAERVIFKNSITYTEEMAQFIAKSYSEYNSAETDVEKKAIMDYVVMRYPNIDVSKIENTQLKNFYNQCIIGGN